MSGGPVGGKVGEWDYDYADHSLRRQINNLEFKKKHDSDIITVSTLKQTIIVEKIFDLPYAKKYYDYSPGILIGRKGTAFLEAGYVFAPYIPLKFN